MTSITPSALPADGVWIAYSDVEPRYDLSYAELYGLPKTLDVVWYCFRYGDPTAKRVNGTCCAIGW